MKIKRSSAYLVVCVLAVVFRPVQGVARQNPDPSKAFSLRPTARLASWTHSKAADSRMDAVSFVPGTRSMANGFCDTSAGSRRENL